MKHIFTFFVLAVLVFRTVFAQNVGEVAPDFSLKDLNEKEYKLSDNRGKVILVFLVGHNCTLCLASAPTIKSELTDALSSNADFQALVIDVWNGSKTSVENFKNSTNINATYLQKGSTVASGWSSTKDRLIVIDAEGKMVFKGSSAAKSDADDAKSAIQTALNNVTTSVEIIDERNGVALKQNYPNPATDRTFIEFSLDVPSEVTLTVFESSGKKVLVPVHQFYQAGNHRVSLGKDQLKRGIYFYRFEAKDFVSVKKMVFQ